MKTRILALSALAATLAIPAAFAQSNTGAGARASAAIPVQNAAQPVPRAADRAVEVVSAQPVAAAKSAVTAEATPVPVTPPAPTVETPPAVQPIATTPETPAVPARAGSQAMNANPRAVEAVSGNPTAVERSAVTATAAGEADADALAGTGQAVDEEEAKQIRMEEAAARKAKRDARKKHK